MSKDILTNIALSLGILIAGLIGIECYLHIQGKHPAQKGYVFDSVLGWVPDYPIGPDADTTKQRVLFIGDSFTQPTDGYVGAFQQLCDSNCKQKIQVINLGVGGFGTAQSYLMLKRYIKKYNPQLVVLGFYVWNDLADNVNDIYYSSACNNNRPAFATPNQKLVETNKPNRFKFVLLNNSAIYRTFVEKSIWQNKNGLKAFFDYQNQYRDFYTPEQTNRNTLAWQLTGNLLKAINEECQQNHSHFIIAGFNNGFATEKKIYDREVANTNGDFLKINIDKPLTTLEQVCKAQNIAFVNVTQKFRNYKQTHTDTLYTQDIAGHFSPVAKQLAADTIFNFVSNNGYGVNCRY